MNGAYQNIIAGHVKDALVDMSGGLSETYNLRREESLPDDLWDIIIKSFDMGSLMASCIAVSFPLLHGNYTGSKISSDILLEKLSPLDQGLGHF